MKNFTKLFAIAVVVLGFSATSFGQIVPLNAEATITSVAAISGQALLNFGTIGTGTAGTVVMSTAGDRTGSANLLPANTGQAGAFTITAVDGSLVKLTKPSSLTTLTTLTGTGTKTMTISSTNWKYKIGTEADDTEHTLAGTSVGVAIGATLDVVANQAIGVYEGTYAFTVALE